MKGAHMDALTRTREWKGPPKRTLHAQTCSPRVEWWWW